MSKSVTEVITKDVTRKHSSYPIEAENLQSCRQQLRKEREWKCDDLPTCRNQKDEKPLAIGESGGFCLLLCCDWEREDNRVARVSLIPAYKIIMPRWRNYPEQSKENKAKWDTMWKNLQLHENGHRNRFMNDVKSIAEELRARQWTIDEIKKHMERKIAEIWENQDKYEKETHHGLSQGVDL